MVNETHFKQVSRLDRGEDSLEYQSIFLRSSLSDGSDRQSPTQGLRNLGPPYQESPATQTPQTLSHSSRRPTELIGITSFEQE